MSDKEINNMCNTNENNTDNNINEDTNNGG